MEQARGIDILFRAIEVGHVHACRGRAICKFFHDHISIIKLQHKQNASSELFWRTAPETALLSVIGSGLITPAMLPEDTLYVVAEFELRNLPAVVEALDDHGLLAPPRDANQVAGLQGLFERCIHRASRYTDRNSYQFRIEKVLLARYPAINPGGIRNLAFCELLVALAAPAWSRSCLLMLASTQPPIATMRSHGLANAAMLT